MEVLTRRNFVSGILKDNFLWHVRQIAIVEEPRTELTPGEGMGVEHSEQVGKKEDGSMSRTVHPSKSK